MAPQSGMSLGGKVIGNVSFNVVGQAYVAGLSFAVVPYLVHHLGIGPYGVVALVVALGGFASLFNFGIGRSLSKHVAELHWRGDERAIGHLFQNALAVALAAGVLIIAIGVGFRGPLARTLVHGDSTVQSLGGIAIVVATLGLLASIVMDVFAGMVVAVQRFEVYSGINILIASIWQIGSVAVLRLHFTVNAVIVLPLIATLIGTAAYVLMLRRLMPSLSFRPAMQWQVLRQLLTFSAAISFGNASTMLVHRSDRLMIAHYYPIAALPFYAIPYALSEKTAMGVFNITSAIFPSVSELASQQQAERLRTLYLRSSKFVPLAALPVTIVLWVLARPILALWIDPTFAAQGTLVLQLLAAGFLINIFGHVPLATAQAMGEPWLAAEFAFLDGAVSLLFFVVLIPRYGAAGAAIAFAIGQLAVVPLLVHAVNRRLGVTWKTLVTQSYWRPLVCAVAGFVFLLICRPFVFSIWRLMIFGFLSLSVFGLIALVAAVDDRERSEFRLRLNIAVGHHLSGWPLYRR